MPPSGACVSGRAATLPPPAKPRPIPPACPPCRSSAGSGAIVWKNLLAARRSQRQLLVAFILTALYAGSLVALLWSIHAELRAATPGQLASPEVVMGRFAFHLGLAFWIAILAPFLQRIFPFDFRRDGRHLLDFRTLPMSPLCLVLAEVAVPVGCVLLCQAAGLVPLLIYARFDWPMVLLLLFAYPAIALAFNSVWNLHYLLSATRRAASKAQSAQCRRDGDGGCAFLPGFRSGRVDRPVARPMPQRKGWRGAHEPTACRASQTPMPG